MTKFTSELGIRRGGGKDPEERPSGWKIFTVGSSEVTVECGIIFAPHAFCITLLYLNIPSI